MIPPNIKLALDKWASNGDIPGDFVLAVLHNDLMDAVCRADADSLASIRDIVLYVYNDLPSPCWGSLQNVNLWLARFKRGC